MERILMLGAEFAYETARKPEPHAGASVLEREKMVPASPRLALWRSGTLPRAADIADGLLPEN